MGVACSVYAVGASASRLLEAESWVRWMASRFTRFSDESELERLNRSCGAWCEISADLEQVLRASLRAFESSGGLVNVGVRPAMIAIGYSRPLAEGSPVVTSGRPRPLPDLRSVLTVRPGRARLAAHAGIDLGGIAKGWMADRLGSVLGANSLANLGGDLMARGEGPGGCGWPVGVGGVTLLLRDQGAATSSVRRRSWDGAHHLIDPRSGAPSASGLQEVSVVATSALEAEIVAKTALIAGRDLAPAYCAANALAWWLSP